MERIVSAEDHARTLATAAQNAALAAQAGKQAIRPPRDDPFYRFGRPTRVATPSTHQEIYPRLNDAPPAAQAAKAAATSPRPFAASAETDGGDLYLVGVRGGFLCLPLAMEPDTTVADSTVDVTGHKTHAWLKVEWDTSYDITAATITFGSAWPSTVFDVTARFNNIPVAFISAGALGQIVTTHLTFHRAFVTGGIVLAPASL